MSTATAPNNTRRGPVTLETEPPRPDHAALLEQVLQQPRYSVGDIETMSKQVTRSQFGGFTEAQAFTLMMVCEADGLHPIQAIRRFHVIKGRPAMRADAILADMMRLGWDVEWTTELDDRKIQEAIFKHKTKCPKSKTVRFTFEDAELAKVSKGDNWQNWTPAMLRARVSTIACRALDPGIIVGLYSVEEVEDMRPSEEQTRLQQGLRSALDEAKRREAGEAPAEAAIQPPPVPQSEFAAWLEAEIAKVNGQWLAICDEAGSPATYKPLANRYAVTNHLIKAWLASGRIAAESIQDESGQRDRDKAAAVFRSIWEGDTQSVKDEIQVYLGNKLGETVAKTKFSPVEAPAVAVGAEADGDWGPDRE